AGSAVLASHRDVVARFAGVDERDDLARIFIADKPVLAVGVVSAARAHAYGEWHRASGGFAYEPLLTFGRDLAGAADRLGGGAGIVGVLEHAGLPIRTGTAGAASADRAPARPLA